MASPDPTADLHWSAFRGAIHDIFASNAKAFPDRTCVIETASKLAGRREFNYRQIFTGACRLAHKLVASGIERGDVVMIFAYRGVDLVVAIMGTLMAGATFSVLDPQYPPDRQIIYLDVARPRALISIEKAKTVAGELADSVRAFIGSNLELRTEIPALSVQDDGSLLGGSVDGVDVLADFTQTDLPGVVVGPDSIPTLSFTSGSEGKPKGVQGRHYSLTYYFDWMAERFNLSDKDAFTMLSGIAHDPIQRDIFTPLFLGARILVPAKEDIEYGKLAAWMRRESATVTHLTPAMGQIMVGGSENPLFPTLHHAFLVGDILIKRDCLRLRALAPNCFIINMFGTTETQRAVSYYEIPSQNVDPDFLNSLGNIIPAGSGMKDVQMLVVDRDNRDRLCDIGETGEIYVRAAGLAEGYLGNDELTKGKFVDNWFIKDKEQWAREDEARVVAAGSPEPWRQFYKGPRDRMYKSGDLGRRMPDGNVECTGRVDNQIKIRGFRIELGDIDAQVTSHPLVRENVTLLRRNENEEQVLVSYIVPDVDAWLKTQNSLDVGADDDSLVGRLRRFRTLRDDLREHLKGKLPEYAVPTVIVPLYRMPLNPNGKVDKPALPFPKTAELAAALPRRRSSTTANLTETEKKLAAVWSKVLKLPVNFFTSSANFYDLGGHSILGVQMLYELKQQISVDITLPTLIKLPTLRGLATEIDNSLDPNGLRLEVSELPGGHLAQDADYGRDALALAKQLPRSFKTSEVAGKDESTVFLTGATGFLGTYLLRELLSRDYVKKVVCLVRAKSAEAGLDRLIASSKAYQLWKDEWAGRIECVCGDLSQNVRLGISADAWEKLGNEADVIIHNGAIVHWATGYSGLRDANVVSTAALLELCATSKAKKFALISSTSTLETDYYPALAEKIVAEGGRGIPESDDLSGSDGTYGRRLTTGYGQTKWASEYLVREAGKRGLSGVIVRPSYITGDPNTGMTITDDYLVRLLKACVQVGSRPAIRSTINQVPVTHVARIVVAATLSPASPLGVAQVTPHPRLRFDQYVGALETFGYSVPELPYPAWVARVNEYVKASFAGEADEFALLPLLHLVTSDLPGDSVAPALDDSNTLAALKRDSPDCEDVTAGSALTEEILGRYISFLATIGFLPAPSAGGKPLPEFTLSEDAKAALAKVGGRGSGPA